MAAYWRYRIADEEFGPVSEMTLRSLIADGTIGPDDQIHETNASDWVRAESLEVELVEQPADASDAAGEIDLDAMLAPSSTASGGPSAADDEWYYRISGQELGPVDFDKLMRLVADRRIGRFDRVRAPGRPEWVEARTIVGLFADEDVDLDSLLESPSSTSAPSPQRQKLQRQKPRWYYRVLNQEMGPVDLDELFDLVMEGNLNRDDDVRGENETDWSRADSLVGLFPDDLDEPAGVANEAPAPTADTDEEEADWYFQMDGQELGPVTFARLMQMAESGRLNRTDPIRLTKLGGWMEAESMVGLFPDESPESEPAAKSASASAPPKSSVPDRPEDGSADDWAAAVLSEPIAEPDPEPEPAPSSPPAPSTPPPQDESPPSTGDSSTSSNAAAAALAAAGGFGKNASSPQRPTFSPPPKPKRSVPSMSMPSGLGEILANPALLGGVGAVALVVAMYMFVPWGSLFAGKGADLLARCETIWNDVEALHTKKGSKAEWEALATKYEPVLKEIAQEAKDRGASPSSPALMIVYSLASDQIPGVLKARQAANENKMRAVNAFIARGKQLE